MVDREVARLDVNLSDWLTVKRHLKALVFGQLLIAALAGTVETTTFLPGRIIECAVVPLVLPASELEARKELVQFLDVAFKLLSFRGALVFDDPAALFVLTTTSRVIPQDQRVRRRLWNEVIPDVAAVTPWSSASFRSFGVAQNRAARPGTVTLKPKPVS